MTTPRMRRRLVCAAAAVSLFALAGCSGSAGSTTSGDTASGGGTSDELSRDIASETGAPGSAPGTDALLSDKTTGLNAPTIDDRSIIRTGTVRLQADEVEKAALAAASAARGLGGLVTGEQTVTDPDPDRTIAQLTLRVPSNRFDDLLVKVRVLGVVLEQTQQASDVTGQVADVDARVEAQQASVRRIQALLARANTIGEVVTVEAQLAQRQADLESLQAQQKVLADQTALATLEVSVVGPDPVGTEDDPTGFLAGLQSGWDAFTAAMTTGLTALGALVPFVGFALVVALPFLAWARSRSRQAPVLPAATAYEPPVREDQPVG